MQIRRLVSMASRAVTGRVMRSSTGQAVPSDWTSRTVLEGRIDLAAKPPDRCAPLKQFNRPLRAVMTVREKPIYGGGVICPGLSQDLS